jgi:hypothetical protein
MIALIANDMDDVSQIDIDRHLLRSQPAQFRARTASNGHPSQADGMVASAISSFGED